MLKSCLPVKVEIIGAVSELSKLPVKVDIIYMNSYLNHIFHHENYLEFIEFLSRRSKYIALIINKKYMTNIETYMPYYNLIKVLNKDTTSYTMFKSNFF